MGRYDNEDSYNVSNSARQRDLVLATNEFAFVMTKTNGAIRTYTGPIMLTISQQESLVVFNSETKRFEDTTDFEKAKQLFVSAPEGWYIVLKNPSKDGTHPEPAKAVSSSELNIGRKVNIPGPCSFSLYPGQMAKVVRGHRLRSNQYLLARVYDAVAAENGRASATIINTDGKEVTKSNEKYFAGQLLVIKGTEVSFYMPPTGIEVIPVTGDVYVRDAVTLERLEYAILKDEDGEKRYVHGPAVVFPKPTETFIESANKSPIFRALELSPISGIYVKVIAEYDESDKEGNTIHHPVGEELFITGNDQMIYYPRPEHAMIQYDGKYMHHAIAIPNGEGRYVLNRLTGEITTVKGPKMYLPDPRTEVVVKRKLTDKECSLIYPGNTEVLEYNRGMNERQTEKQSRNGKLANPTDLIMNGYGTANQEKTLAIFEANANISRGVSYTKPRTITLDTKYDGVVGVNVWTGYAINVVSKTGKREVVVGPTTRLLDYDETLEAMELSTGKPKTTDNLLETVYLRVENNKISDIVNVQTKDFVDVQIKISYCVDFLDEYKNKWFSVENYVKYLCDKQRSLLKQEAKKYNIEEFYTNASTIVRNVCLDEQTIANADTKASVKTRRGRLFKENGMLVHDVEVLSIAVEAEVAKILSKHQSEIIGKTLELSDATAKMAVITKLADYKKQELELNHQNELYGLELELESQTKKLANEAEIKAKQNEQEKATRQAEADMQALIDAVSDARLARCKKEDEAKMDTEKQLADIEKARQESYAATVAKIMESIGPDLVAAMTTRANVDMMNGIGDAVSPYAMAKGESVVDTIQTLIRGTSFEQTLRNINSCKIEE